MEGDTKKTQVSDTNTSPSTSPSANPPTSNNPKTPTSNSVNFSSHDIGRTTIAHKDHTYFTNVKKSHKSLKQFFSQSPKEIFTKKRIIIITIIILLLIGAIITAIFFLTNQLHNSTDNQNQTNDSSQSDSVTVNEEETKKQIEEYGDQINQLYSETQSDNQENRDNEQTESELEDLKNSLYEISTAENTSEENRIEATYQLVDLYRREQQNISIINILEKQLSSYTFPPTIQVNLLDTLNYAYQQTNDTTGQKNTLERMLPLLNQIKNASSTKESMPIEAINDLQNYCQTELEKLNHE